MNFSKLVLTRLPLATMFGIREEIIPHFDKEPRILRPANFPKGTLGKGISRLADAQGRVIVVVQLMARLFMDPLDDPFAAVENMLETWRLGSNAQAIVLDFHGEASSEKMAMGHFLDGRVSVVVGTTPTYLQLTPKFSLVALATLPILECVAITIL